MIRRHNTLIINLTLLAEAFICAALYVVFLWFYGLWGTTGAKQSVAMMCLIYGFIVVHGGMILYRPNTHVWQIPMLVLKNTLKFLVVYFLLLWLADIHLLPRLGKVWFFVGLFTTSTVFRISIYYIVRFLRRHDPRSHRLVLVGSQASNIEIFRMFKTTPELGYRVMGYFDHEPNPDVPEECPYLGRPEDVAAYLEEKPGIHHLYCSLDANDKDVILDIIHYCVNHLVNFYSVPNVRLYLHNRMYFTTVGNVPVLSLYDSPLSIPEKRLFKRAFDICFSLLFLCTLFPVILIIVSIVTLITMPGPIFFRQKRNGLNGKTFYCLKFRSMRVNKDADRVQATRDDPRMTKWGRIMRKTNIDELPQFINVLLGHMSIVGPRPHMEKHTAQYSQLIDKYMMRHLVKPGITGWSQVTGFRGETRELWQMEERVKRDIWYIEHWSFGLDLFIIYKTIANAVVGDKEAF